MVCFRRNHNFTKFKHYCFERNFNSSNNEGFVRNNKLEIAY